MCMIMAGHLHIAIGGGFCAYFFVIMSGVLCRLSYRGGVGTIKICAKYTWHRMYKLLVPHVIGLFLASIFLYYNHDWKIANLIGGVFFLHCWSPQIPYFSVNSVEWTVSALIGAWFLSPLFAERIRHIHKNCVRILLYGNLAYVILRLLSVDYLYNIRKLQLSEFSAWILNNKNPTLIIPLYFIGLFLAELLQRKKVKTSNRLEIMGLFIIMTVFIWMFRVRQLTDYKWTYVFWTVLCSVVLIRIFWTGDGIVSEKIFGCKVITCLSSYSMEIYLIHYPIIALFKNILKFDGFVLVFYAIGLTVLLAIAAKNITAIFTKIFSKYWNWDWISRN